MSSQPVNQELLESQVLRLLDLQRKLLAVVAQPGVLSERLDAVCQLFEQAVHGMVATVMRLQDDERRLDFVSAPNAPHDLLDELDHALLGDGNGSCAHAAWSGKATYVSDAVSDPHWANVKMAAKRHGVHSCWSAPVLDQDGKVCGTFALTSLHSSLPDPYQQQLLDLGAVTVGLLFNQDSAESGRAANDEAIRNLALAADASPNGILFIGPDLRVEWSSAGAHHLLERAGDDIEGRPLEKALGMHARDGRLKELLHALKHQQHFAGTLELIRPSGKRWLAQVTGMPRPTDRGPSGMLMLVDVTTMQRLSNFNVLLAKVDHAVAEADDPHALLQSICELSVRHAGLALAWIGRPDETTGWFEFLAAAGPGKHYLDVVRISSNTDLPEGRGPAGATWNDGQARFDCSFEGDPILKPWAQAARDHDFAAIAVLPIRRAGKLWAELTVYHSQLHSFDETMQQLLETLALNISTGLDRFDLAHSRNESLALNESMLENTSVGMVLTRNRVIMRANRRAAEIFGLKEPDELVGMSTVDFYVDEEASKAALQQAREAFSNKRRAILEVDARRVDGQRIWLRVEGMPFKREGYDEIWSLMDQTEKHHAQETQRLLAHALASVQEGVLLTDPDQRVVYVNDAFEKLTGYSLEQMRGRKCSVLQGPETDPETIRDIHESLHQNREFAGEILNYRRDGSTFWNMLLINPLMDDKGQLTHYVGIQRDITPIRQLNKRLEHLAFHDELTGLPNRRALDRFFAEQLSTISHGRQMLAVGIIDLDDFKVINDTHGHVAGDRLLKVVADRIQPLIRKNDFFARLGGDEFVVVFHDRGRFRADARMQKRFETLGACFTDPFEISPGERVSIGLSMGVALAPRHADVGGMLLRFADEALFKAKRHKSEKRNWWSIYGEASEQLPQTAFAPYGDAGADLLDQARVQLEAGLERMVDDFYEKLVAEPNAAGILDGLRPEEFQNLKQRQVDHIRFLLSPDILRDDMIETSSRIGRSHALIGVDSVLLMHWMAAYRDTLVSACGNLRLASKDRYQLVQIVEHRLQDDLQAQLEALNAVHDRYAAVIDQFMPEHGAGWNDAIGVEIRLLGRLPGVNCGMVLRPSSQQTFSIEWCTGSLAQATTRALLDHFGENESEYIRPSDGCLISRCWESVEIISLASIGPTEPGREPGLPGELMDLGVRSAVCIPIHDENRIPVALILLCGAFPNQFESRQMRQFKRNLQMRGNEIWQRSMRPPPPVPHEQAVSFRRRLFNDGLCFYLQPVINLHTGELMKVEALARLRLADGRILGPDVFLPLLRQSELNALFEQGLDQAMKEILKLEQAGLTVELALNIAPSTLSEPDCYAWVITALDRHGIAPSRLVLEILENQRVDRKARDENVMRLIDHGVRFAIDDLGSGYSSLRRLASLPFHALKVDQDLLARLYSDPVQTVSLISAVIQIGRDFGCEVIAEGLEDQGMIEVARLLGASMGQGYAIAQPMPVDELVAWNRQFRLAKVIDAPQTPIGALAFQWISLRHRSMHAKDLDTCPFTVAMREFGGAYLDDGGLHELVHAHPRDINVARQLLEWLQETVRVRGSRDPDTEAEEA